MLYDKLFKRNKKCKNKCIETTPRVEKKIQVIYG